MDLRRIGQIELGSKVVVSDPCYNLGTWCMGVLYDVKPGEYSCFINCIISDWGNRIKELFIIHKSSPVCPELVSELMDFEVGVDSATAGIFDYLYYEKTHEDRENFDKWFNEKVIGMYDDGKDMNLSTNITDQKGVLCTSGYGDGGYDCFVHRNSVGQIDAIKVVFINDKEESEGECYSLV